MEPLSKEVPCVLADEEYVQCAKCKKLIPIHPTSSLKVFKSIHDSSIYILHGSCPCCNHKYNLTHIRISPQILKRGIKVIEGENGKIEKLIVWYSKYYMVNRVPKTETLLYCYKIDLTKHTYISFKKRNGKLIKKSLKFNTPHNIHWFVNIYDLLKNYDFTLNNKDLRNFIIEHHFNNNKILCNSNHIAEIFRYANIRVGGVRLIGKFNRYQVKKLKRYVKKYGYNIPPKKFVELMLYGKPKGNIPYRDFLKFFRVNTYSLHPHNLFYHQVYELSKLLINPHDTLDFSIMARIISHYSNHNNVMNFIKRLLSFNTITTTKKLLIQFIYSLNRDVNRPSVRWCFDYLVNKYKPNELQIPPYTIAIDVFWMLSHELNQSEFENILPLLKQEFPKGVSIPKLHDFLSKVILEVKRKKVKYKYTNYISKIFTQTIDNYQFTLPKDTLDLKLHAGSMCNCSYSVYRNKHNKNQLIVMVKDKLGKDVATLRFSHQNKEFSKLRSEVDVELVYFKEAKLEHNKKVLEDNDVNRVIIKYFNALKNKLGNKIILNTQDIKL